MYTKSKTWKKESTIFIPKIISDHPMIIYQMSIQITFKEKQEIIRNSTKKLYPKKKYNKNYNYIQIFKSPISYKKKTLKKIFK